MLKTIRLWLLGKLGGTPKRAVRPRGPVDRVRVRRQFVAPTLSLVPPAQIEVTLGSRMPVEDWYPSGRS